MNRSAEFYRPKVAVIGAAGQTGELFTRELAQTAQVSGVVRDTSWQDEDLHPNIGFYSDFATLRGEVQPEIVILATPNPAEKILEEIAPNLPERSTLVLPQNGVAVPERALSIIQNPEVYLVRAGLFTIVSRNPDGTIAFNPKKKRITLASIPRDEETWEESKSLSGVADMFIRAGFDARTYPDYNSMQWTKLVANLYGSSGEVTGDVGFASNEILDLEIEALRQRMAVMEAAGIPWADIPWVKSLKGLAELKGGKRLFRSIAPSAFRAVVSHKTKKERNNQPSAAARAIFTEDPDKTAQTVEPTEYYHRAFTRLAEAHHMRIPFDDALRDILKAHEDPSNSVNLAKLPSEERRKLLLEIADLESIDLFVPRNNFVHWVTKSIFLNSATDFENRIHGDLTPVIRALRVGESVALVPNHDGHANHPAVDESLRRKMGNEYPDHPVYMIANLQFNASFLTKRLFRAYPHVRVWTLNEDDTPEDRWRAQLVNSRASNEIDKLFYPPHGVQVEKLEDGKHDIPPRPQIWVLYIEGSRSRDGVLQPPKPGATSLLRKSGIKWVVPVAMTGTGEILPPEKAGERGKIQLPHRTDNFSITFGEPISTKALFEEAKDAAGRGHEDGYVGPYLMRKIAAMLPEEQRGIFGN